jgi:hypothetical protein
MRTIALSHQGRAACHERPCHEPDRGGAACGCFTASVHPRGVSPVQRTALAAPAARTEPADIAAPLGRRRRNARRLAARPSLTARHLCARPDPGSAPRWRPLAATDLNRRSPGWRAPTCARPPPLRPGRRGAVRHPENAIAPAKISTKTLPHATTPPSQTRISPIYEAFLSAGGGRILAHIADLPHRAKFHPASSIQHPASGIQHPASGPRPKAQGTRRNDVGDIFAAPALVRR